MQTLCIQIQPDRVADFDEAIVLATCQGLRVFKPLITAFQMEQGEDDGPWVNLSFETEQPARVWPLLQAAFYDAGPLGDVMRASSMAMCSGKNGWDDYLLLYHYDNTLELDSFDETDGTPG